MNFFMKVSLLVLSLLIFATLATSFSTQRLLPNQSRQEPDPRPLTDEEINLAKSVGASDIFYVSNPMTKEERQKVDAEFEQAMKSLDKYAQKTDRAVSKMINLAAFMLERKGYKAEAAQVRKEYAERYSRAVYYTYMQVTPADLGDHKPLSEWLADWYAVFEALLGTRVMEITHLVDINVMNFAIPVVFHPRGWQGDSWDKVEYKKHFVPFGGVVSYWTTWAACVGATWGAGAIVFICSPIGEVSKFVTMKWVAPPISDWIYDLATQ